MPFTILNNSIISLLYLLSSIF